MEEIRKKEMNKSKTEKKENYKIYKLAGLGTLLSIKVMGYRQRYFL